VVAAAESSEQHMVMRSERKIRKEHRVLAGSAEPFALWRKSSPFARCFTVGALANKSGGLSTNGHFGWAFARSSSCFANRTKRSRIACSEPNVNQASYSKVFPGVRANVVSGAT
jgi:hypothetical protein